MARHPLEDEWFSLFDLLNGCFRPQGEQMERCFPHFLCEANREHLWVSLEGGEIISHVGYLPDTWVTPEMTWKVGRIGAVCTHEAHRGKGWGSELLLSAMEAARLEGLDLFVISGDRGLYERQGGVRCGRIERFQLAARDLASFAREDIRLLPYTEEKFSLWLEQQRKEPIRRACDPGEWEILMGKEIIPWMREARHQPFLVCQGDDVIATLVLWSRSSYTEVIEWTGTRADCLAGLALYAAMEGAVLPLRWSLPWYEQEACSLLHQKGFSGEVKEADGVVCVLRWEALTERIQGILRHHFGEEAASVTLREEGSLFTMEWPQATLRWQGRGTLARLLFGEPAFGGEDRLPAPVFEGADAWARWEMLKQILPLPRPVYGMGYI